MNSQFHGVWVITLNWNGRQWLEDCLSSVLAMDYPGFEVVMVDNGSVDGSVELVRERFPSVHIVTTGRNLGYARGFNAGLEYAASCGARYFLIMNNDTVIDRSALAELIKTAREQERAGFVGGKIYYFDHPTVLQTAGKAGHPIRWQGVDIGARETDVGQYEKVEERVFIDDVMTLVDRRLYDEVGGYDVNFFLQCEEFDWQARAKKAGWRFYYTPGAKLWHRVSMSMGGEGNPIGQYFLARNFTVVMARHVGLVRFMRYYFHAAYVSVRLFMRGLLVDRSRFKRGLAYLLGFVAGTLWLVHRRPATRVPSLIAAL